MASKGIIGICGSGIVGRGMAMVFAGAGYQVNLFDKSHSQIDLAMVDIKEQLNRFHREKIIRGTRSVEEHLSLIKGVTSLKDCAKGAVHIQECIPESLELKKTLYTELDQLVGSDTIMGSASSAIPSSAFTKDLKNRSNCLINHPVIPPYFIRLTEIVPATWTSPEAVSRTRSLMEDAGQAPVTFKNELLGFGINRLQLTILNECWHLVHDGGLSIADVDTLMSEGLGMRYALQGAFAVAHLSAEGFDTAIRQFRYSFEMMGKTLKQMPDWNEKTVLKIHNELIKQYPVEKLEEARKWREDKLAALAKLKGQDHPTF